MIAWIYNLIVGRCFHEWTGWKITTDGGFLIQRRLCRKCSKTQEEID